LLLLLITANVIPTSCHPDDGDDTFHRNVILTRATRRNIP
jgi:hypothetical protein